MEPLQCRRDVGKELQSLPTEDRIEGLVIEREWFGVGLDELDVVQTRLCRPLAPELEHVSGDVNGQHPPVGATTWAAVSAGSP